MSAGTTASIEETQPARKAAPLSRSLPSLLNMLHKRWPSMKADACLYSFRFVLLLERISVQSVRCIWRFSRFAVRHCKAEVSLYSFRFVFLERIPVQPERGVWRFSCFCSGSLPVRSPLCEALLELGVGDSNIKKKSAPGATRTPNRLIRRRHRFSLYRIYGGVLVYI
jgi:hypothetical protein